MFPWWSNFILCFLKLEINQNNLKFLLRGCGYIFGGILLIRQVYISRLRVQALESTARAQLKTAEAQLKNNVEIRYNNTLEYFSSNKENPLAQLGAIYQLYYIAKSNHEYSKIVLDLLLERLLILCEKKPCEDTTRRVGKKEKQAIVDKLFKDHVDSQSIFGQNYTHGLELVEINLEGLCFSEACLFKANLRDSNIKDAVFKNANLSEATLPTKLSGCRDMSGVKLNNVKIYSQSELQGLRLTNAEIKNSLIVHAYLNNANLERANLSGTDLSKTDLSGANLSGANLSGVKGLTFNQLKSVKSLYETMGLEQGLQSKLKREYANLFHKNF